MKNKTINALIAILLGSVALFSCTKEPPIKPNAKFSTKLVDNTAYAGETFYIYFTNTSGEFFTLFTGVTDKSTYDPNDPTKTGTAITSVVDSFPITSYNSAGTYPLTLVAASSGNWAEDYEKSVYTLDVTVKDRRSGFTSFSIDKINGEFVPGTTTILFYATKGTNLTAKKAKWLTASAGAEVYVNNELQESGRTTQDFSPINSTDNEGRTVIYSVVAPDGASTDYDVKYILSDPSTDNTLYALSSSTGATFTIGASTVQIFYYSTSNLSAFNLLASAGKNAVVKVGNTAIQDKAASVDLVNNNIIKVIAEDKSEKDYAVTLTVIDVFTSFQFTQMDDGSGTLVDLYPVPEAVIDPVAKTITISVFGYSPTTNNKLVATFTGIDHQTVKIGSTVLTSGTTEFTYDASPYEVKLFDGATLRDTYTLTINAGK